MAGDDRDIPIVPLTDDLLAVVLELAPDGIAVTDPIGRMVHANGRFQQLFGYSREQLLGHTVETLIPTTMQSAHRGHRAQFADVPLARPMGTGADLMAQHADGTIFPVDVGLSPVSTTAGTSTIIAVRSLVQRRAHDDQVAGDAAVKVERDRMAIALNDAVIRKIFSSGLRLHGLLEGATDQQLTILDATIDELDDAIRQVRTRCSTLGRERRGTCPAFDRRSRAPRGPFAVVTIASGEFEVIG